MIPLHVTLNLELDPWADLAGKIPDDAGTLVRIGILPDGMESGRAAVELIVRNPDGSLIVAETSLRLFLMAASAISAAPVTELEDL